MLPGMISERHVCLRCPPPRQVRWKVWLWLPLVRLRIDEELMRHLIGTVRSARRGSTGQSPRFDERVWAADDRSGWWSMALDVLSAMPSGIKPGSAGIPDRLTDGGAASRSGTLASKEGVRSASYASSGSQEIGQEIGQSAAASGADESSSGAEGTATPRRRSKPKSSTSATSTTTGTSMSASASDSGGNGRKGALARGSFEEASVAAEEKLGGEAWEDEIGMFREESDESATEEIVLLASPSKKAVSHPRAHAHGFPNERRHTCTRTHARAHARAHMHPHAHMHAHMHARTPPSPRPTPQTAAERPPGTKRGPEDCTSDASAPAPRRKSKGKREARGEGRGESTREGNSEAPGQQRGESKGNGEGRATARSAAERGADGEVAAERGAGREGRNSAERSTANSTASSFSRASFFPPSAAAAASSSTSPSGAKGLPVPPKGAPASGWPWPEAAAAGVCLHVDLEMKRHPGNVPETLCAQAVRVHCH